MKQSDLFKLKVVAVLIAVLLTIYPVVELSRCIIQYNLLWPEGWGGNYHIDSYAELGFIWFWFLLMPFVIWWFMGIAAKVGRHSS